MVASLRCNELKDESLDLIKEAVNGLRNRCLKGFQTNFKVICSSILNTAEKHYDNYAVSYDKTVYKKIKEELKDAIMQKLYICFDA